MLPAANICRYLLSAAKLSRRLMKRNTSTRNALSATTSAPPYKAIKTSMIGTTVPTIQLNEREARLRKLLLDVAGHVDATAQPPLQGAVTLRWAGGWVRDKLLNIDSHDIDVAINNMTGEHFAEHMSGFCKSTTVIQKHAIGVKDIGNLHKVAKNPDKSKHLETAMVRMFGLDLDFVNLRKETYADDSRNPTMEFGTAEEDAVRRDATINALFYNLHTGQIEDFTGGLEDMNSQVIRTPLEPFQTFTDDPLRVLRLVRFASRLLFVIDPPTQHFMSDRRVLEALKVKISRERVGKELEKMLQGKHPRKSLELIDELKLYHAIFTDPTDVACPQPSTKRWNVVYQCLDKLMSNHTPQSICDHLIRTDEASYTAWNLAALTPWMLNHNSTELTRKPNALPLVALVSREGFKAPNKLSSIIAAAYRHRQDIIAFKKGALSRAAFALERDTLGMAIRNWDNQGGLWKVQLLNALLVEAMETLDHWNIEGSRDRDEFLSGWQSFLDHITELDLWDAPTLKRPMDGKQLSEALGIRPGKWTGKALDVITAWRFRNPSETDLSAAVEEVRRKKKELGIPLA